ncbi:MAG: aminopeptidase P family protein [Pseudomonadota bacterium]
MSFQTFEAMTRPEDGPPRLARLREHLKAQGLDGFLVPRADAHQGEYVAPSDERLAWLTGFTGSAGFAAVLGEEAGVFVDGRYTTQVKAQVDTAHFTPVPWPKTKLGPWLAERMEAGQTMGYDPWLHTGFQISEIEKAFEEKGIKLKPMVNAVDAVWEGRPGRPTGDLSLYPERFAGRSADEKRAEIAKILSDAGEAAALLTLPESIAWLLNIRGSDIPRTPVAHAFAVISADGAVDLFTDAPASDAVRDHLGQGVRFHPYGAFHTHIGTLKGKARIHTRTAPHILWGAVAEPVVGDDPCFGPQSKKTSAEIAATTEAHLRDGAAMAEFLAWLDAEAPKGALTEIAVAQKLEACRIATGELRDISFDTISGSGPNGAIVHYRVTRDTDRAVSPGELLLVDSGGQYLDGTTDVTRTMAIGTPTDEHREAFTQVLQGMIAVSLARWPKGLTGRDLDPLARAPLWRAGKDYDHGTGHGVGVYLSVHEGPHGITRRSKVVLEPGMIVSNEPGYYREGAFGIRIENLVTVVEAPPLEGADDREMLAFDTLTYVPIDRRLIDMSRLAPAELDWLNAYHARVKALISPRVSDTTRVWLDAATAPL